MLHNLALELGVALCCTNPLATYFYRQHYILTLAWIPLHEYTIDALSHFPWGNCRLFPVLYLNKKCNWQRLVCIFLGTHLGLGGSGLLIRDIFTLSNCSPKWPHQCIFFAMKTSLYSDIFSNTRDSSFCQPEETWKSLTSTSWKD